MAATKTTELAQFAKTLTVDGSGNTTLTGTVTETYTSLDDVVWPTKPSS